jgi:hypothetical protein
VESSRRRPIVAFLVASCPLLGSCSIHGRNTCTLVTNATESPSSQSSWCEGSSIAACKLSPECYRHPDTCDPETLVTSSPCEAPRPICAQAGSAAICEVSDVVEGCTPGPPIATGQDIGPSADFNGDRLTDWIGLNTVSTVYVARADLVNGVGCYSG